MTPVFIMSFWKCSKYIQPKIIKVFNYSFNLLKSHGYKVHFFGNDDAIKEFSVINWDCTNNCLNNLNQEYKYVWSLGKVYTFKIASQIYEQFYHIDGDVFIFDKIPDNIFEKNLVLQEDEPSNRYNFDLLKANCGYLPEIFNVIPDTFYNMGFFGGKSNYLKPLLDNHLNFILHPDNKYFFTNVRFWDTLTQPLLAEQGFMGCYLNFHKIQPFLIKKHIKKYYHHGLHKIRSPEKTLLNLETIEKYLKSIYN